MSFLKRVFFGRVVDKKHLKLNLFTKAQEKAMLNATKIKDLKGVKVFSDLLTDYWIRADILAEPTVDGSSSIAPYKFKDIGELPQVTAQELKQVHAMPLKQGNEWLRKNQYRVTRIFNAILSGVITDKATVYRLRLIDPTKAIAEIRKMRKEKTEKDRQDSAKGAERILEGL